MHASDQGDTPNPSRDHKPHWGLVALFALMTIYGPQATDGLAQMTNDLSSVVSATTTMVRDIDELLDDLGQE